MDQKDIDIAALRQQNAKLMSDNARLKTESIERQRQWSAFIAQMINQVGNLPKSDEASTLLSHVKGVKLMGWDTTLSNQHVVTTEIIEPVISEVLVSPSEPIKQPPPPVPKQIKKGKEDASTEHSDTGSSTQGNPE